jgi:hypothetical protein
MPARSTASHDVSSRSRRWESMAAASRSPMPKNDASKPATVVEETAPSRHRPARNPWLGVVEIRDVPSVGGNLGDQVVAA